MPNRMRELMKREGWTPTTLAAKVGCSAATLHHYMTERTAPTPEVAAKIAARLKSTVAALKLRARGVRGNRPGRALNATRLKAAMEQADSSGRELAERVGIHPERLYAYRSGKARVSDATLARLARALRVKPEDLLAPARSKPAPARAKPAPARAKPAPARAKPAPARAKLSPAKKRPAAKRRR